MTERATGGTVLVDSPEGWFERMQRAIEALRRRAEHVEAEVARRERDLEERARERARHEEALAGARQEIERRTEDLTARIRGLDQREREVSRAEAALRREREEFTESRRQPEKSLGTVKPEEAGPEPKAVPERNASEVLRHLKALREALESATEAVRTREAEAETQLADATERAAHAHELELRLDKEKSRLGGLQAELVNAQHALSAVDEALARMPYEVVDEFTKSREFVAYERAVQVLKRFEQKG